MRFRLARDLRLMAALLVAIALLTVWAYPALKQQGCVEAASGVYGNISTLISRLGIQVFVSKDASHHLNTSSLEALGLKVSAYDISLPPRIDHAGVIVLNVTDLAYEPARKLELLIEAIPNTSRVVVFVLNPYGDEALAKTAYGVILKYYGYRGLMPLMVLEPPVSSDKHRALAVKPEIFKARALGFGFNPSGFMVIEDLRYFDETLLLALKWAGFIGGSDIKDSGLSKVLGSTSIVSIEGFKYIGYIGWITTNFTGSVCGEVTGYMAVKVDYYANTTTIAGKTYHGFLAHIEHSAKGYKTTCCQFIFCSTINHYPKIFISKTDWHTDIFPGQVLDDRQPKNTGSASTITYTVSWNPGFQFATGDRAVVSYSTSTSTAITQPNYPYYAWYGISDPPYGVVAVKHELQLPKDYDVSQLNYVLFTVEPSSIGFLDPDKPGGILPMVVSHYFETELNTGDKASISFTTSLWPGNVVTW